MNIRKARLEDVEKNLLNLYVDGFEYHHTGRPDIFPSRNRKELKEDLINTINNSNILVLEDNEEILGYVVYQLKEKRDKTLWIDELVVDKDNRHSGNGKKLMEKIKEIAKKENCKRVEFCCWSFNQNAMEMYKHIGYKEQRSVLEINL